MGNLAGAELGVIDAVAAAQAANLSFVIRPLRRVAARLVDETVPDVDIDDSGLLRSAAVELVEIGGIGARLGAALRRQTDPYDRNACALEGGNGRIDAPDIGEVPLLRVEFPRSIRGLACLLRRHIGVFGGLGGGGRLLLRVGRRGRNRWSCGRTWLCRLRIRLGRGGTRRRRGGLFADRLTVVVSDHHDDEFGLLGRNDFAHHLRPLEIAALIVADQAGIGAMLAHDANVRVLGKGIFEPVGQPIGVGVAHHHDRGRGFGLFLRRCRGARIIDRRLPFLAVGIVRAALIPAAAEPVVVPLLLLALRTAAPIPPELRLRRQQQREAHARDRDRDTSSKSTG